jgi:hypothetical protein
MMEMLGLTEKRHTYCSKARQPGMPPVCLLKLQGQAFPLPSSGSAIQLDASAKLLEGRDQLRERRMLRLNRLTSL